MNPSGIFDLSETILLCVCDQMDAIADDDEDYPGCSCLSYVSAGEPTIDCCVDDCTSNGMLTVHIDSVYPSSDFPLPDTAFQPCKAAVWVAVVVVTASRCVPTFDGEQGNLPSAEDLNAAARVQAIDHYAVLTALGCCVVNDPPAGKQRRRVQLQQSQAITSDGGCGAVEVRAFIEVDRVCSCTSPVS